jgi:hypothetical protein
MDSGDDDTPPGVLWDGENYSCAYDSLFVILYSIWTTKPKKWKKNFKDCNVYLSMLLEGFQKYLADTNSLEVARDNVRSILHEDNPVQLPYGYQGTSVALLATRMLYPVYRVSKPYICCSQCDHTVIIDSHHVSRVIFVPENTVCSTAQVVSGHFSYQTNQTCDNCMAPLESTVHFDNTPKILALNFSNQNFPISRTVKVMGADRFTVLHLKGIVYHGDFHFVCRVFADTGKIWFNDGIRTGRDSVEDGWLGRVSQPNLNMYQNKQACLIVYAQN